MCATKSADGGAGHDSDFAQVDRTSDPACFVRYLDAASATDWARAYKLRTFALLAARAGDRVLDVGSGTGDDTRALARLIGPTGHVLGVDNSITMVAEATRRAEGLGLSLQYRLGDIHQLEFPDGSFDACRADRVLQHVADPERALAEITRVVRPGGNVVVSEPDWYTLLIDAPDYAVTGKIVEVRARQIRNARIGRELWRRLSFVGLRAVDVYAETLIVHDYASADRLFMLASAAQAARDVGVVDPADAAAWMRSLEDADRLGRFFSAATIFTGRGIMPE